MPTVSAIRFPASPRGAYSQDPPSQVPYLMSPYSVTSVVPPSISDGAFATGKSSGRMSRLPGTPFLLSGSVDRQTPGLRDVSTSGTNSKWRCLGLRRTKCSAGSTSRTCLRYPSRVLRDSGMNCDPVAWSRRSARCWPRIPHRFRSLRPWRVLRLGRPICMIGASGQQSPVERPVSVRVDLHCQNRGWVSDR